jgi:hypothetical protein
VRTTMEKPVINELVKRGHSRIICKNRQKDKVFAYELGSLVRLYSGTEQIDNPDGC